MRKRHAWVTTLLIFTSAMIVGFQNFSSVRLAHPMMNLADLKPRLPSAAARASRLAGDGEGDIREVAPSRPTEYDSMTGSERSSIAAPTSGNDLASIGQNWAQQQAHLLTNGNDEKFLQDINRRMNRLLRNATSNTDGTDEIHSSESPDPAREARRVADEESSSAPSLRFTAVNRFELGFANSTNLSCSVDGDAIHWDISRPLATGLNLNFRHENVNNANTIRLHYSW